jgi:Trypsin
LQTDYQCGGGRNALRNRINGGNITATPAQFPFHVAIFYESRYRCGGSLLSQTATISAAHCVVNSSQNLLPFENFRLLFGSVDLKNLTGNEAIRKVKDILKHGDYEYDRILKFDIAIIRMEGKLQFSPFIQPICLPDLQVPSIDMQINKHFIILGFGSSTETLQISRYLHYGFMTVISRSQCTEKIIFALLPEQSTFCAIAKDNVLACPGKFNLFFLSFQLNVPFFNFI